VAELITDGTVTPEQFGYQTGDDLGVVVNKMLASRFTNIRLYAKKYTLITPILAKDIVGGCIEGATSSTNGGATAFTGTETFVFLENLQENAGIKICGCYGFKVKNMHIVGNRQTVGADYYTACAIYIARSLNHPSSEGNDILDCTIQMGRYASACNGHGTTGIYNDAGEAFEINRCRVGANNCYVHTHDDCFGIYNTIGDNYKYPNATCSAIYMSGCYAGGCDNAIVLSKVLDVQIHDFFYQNSAQVSNPAIIYVMKTSGNAGEIHNVNINVHMEQHRDDALLLKCDYPLTISGCNMSLSIPYVLSRTSAHNLFSTGDQSTSYWRNNTFTLFDAITNVKTANQVIADFSAFNYLTMSNCVFNTPNKVILCSKNSYGNIVNGNAEGVGYYGSSKINDRFPLSLNGQIIGERNYIPTITDENGVKDGSICFCSLGGSTVAFWIYKKALGGWKAVSID
jgi:hypothetical protein